jgi:predicted chitinase
VECRSMRDIAESLNYSVKNIERIHSKAVESFTLIYGKEKDLVC